MPVASSQPKNNPEHIRTWYPIYPGDYLKETMHLNAEEHGAYQLLRMQYWLTGPLSLHIRDEVRDEVRDVNRYDKRDIQRLLNIARLTGSPTAENSLLTVLELFHLENDLLYHRELDILKSEAIENVSKNKKRTIAATKARLAKKLELEVKNGNSNERYDTRDEQRHDNTKGNVTFTSPPSPIISSLSNDKKDIRGTHARDVSSSSPPPPIFEKGKIKNSAIDRTERSYLVGLKIKKEKGGILDHQEQAILENWENEQKNNALHSKGVVEKIQELQKTSETQRLIKPDIPEIIDECWTTIKQKLQTVVGQEAYRSWLSQLHLVEKTEQKIVLVVSKNFTREWIINHYHVIITKMWQEMLQKNVLVEIALFIKPADKKDIYV